MYKGGDGVTELEEIYRKYFTDVFLYILRLSGDKWLAEDITSETFFKAMKSLDRFRGECDIRVWLCQIAKNCFYSYVKKSKRSVGVADEQLYIIPDQSVPLEERLDTSVEAKEAVTALKALPEPYKGVFMWRVYAELSFKQIGQIYKKTDNWACVTYHRAKKMICQKLGKESGIDEK